MPKPLLASAVLALVAWFWNADSAQEANLEPAWYWYYTIPQQLVRKRVELITDWEWNHLCERNLDSLKWTWNIKWVRVTGKLKFSELVKVFVAKCLQEWWKAPEKI